MKQTVFIFMCVLTSMTAASQAHTSASHFNLAGGLAIEGYDPVAYFTSQKAVEGEKTIFSVYQGVRYQFSSTSNKAMFDKEPEKYLPQYGGWCAYAMGAKGEKVAVDPATFKIRNGKLYLFYNSFFNNTLPKWNENERVLEQQADRHWENITGKTLKAN